ncbi:hypothetical protein ACLOJK_036487 [Asimina triloba]
MIRLLMGETLLWNLSPDNSWVRLSGRLKKVPRLLRSLSNLTHLWLHSSHLKEEEEEELLPSLQALPNLVADFIESNKASTKLSLDDEKAVDNCIFKEESSIDRVSDEKREREIERDRRRWKSRDDRGREAGGREARRREKQR